MGVPRRVCLRGGRAGRCGSQGDNSPLRGRGGGYSSPYTGHSLQGCWSDEGICQGTGEELVHGEGYINKIIGCVP